MTDKLTPAQLRDLADIVGYEYPYIAVAGIRARPYGDLAQVIREEAARREAEAKPQKRCDRLIPPVCVHPEACKSVCTFGEGTMAYAASSEREGPGSAADEAIKQIGKAMDDFELGRAASGVPGANVCTPQGEREGPGSAAADDLVTRLRQGAQVHIARVDPHKTMEWQAADRIERLEADKAELVAALEMFNGPITHATFERARMTLAKHGGA